MPRARRTALTTAALATASMLTTSVATGAAVVIALIVVERRHPEPLIPPKIIVERTTALAIIGSIAVGIAQFGTTYVYG